MGDSDPESDTVYDPFVSGKLVSLGSLLLTYRAHSDLLFLSRDRALIWELCGTVCHPVECGVRS